MAYFSNLLSVAEPSGFWVNIIKAFENVTLNYVLAIIFLTVVLRLIMSIIEIPNKFVAKKQQDVNAKMQPELDKLKVKYKNQPALLAQKQREVQQRYMGRGMVGMFLVMLVFMAFNLAVFFTLFSGLNSMAAYKMSSSYDNMKYQYANCLNVADNYLGENPSEEKLSFFKDYENIEFVVSQDGQNIAIFKNGEPVEGSLIEFKTDFAGGTKIVVDEETGESQEVELTSNDNIYALIQKYEILSENEEDQIVIDTKITPVEDGEDIVENVYLSTAIQNISMRTLGSYYDLNKDSFLWIENIWQADSPFTKSIGEYQTLVRQLGKNAGAHEEEIYTSFMKDLKAEKSRTNGYLILPILCVLSSMLSLYINSLYTKLKNKKNGILNANDKFKKSQIILPIIFGFFALFYNSVFAIYLFVGQLVAALVTPLQLLIIDKIVDKKKKKEDEKIVVDYSRKF